MYECAVFVHLSAISFMFPIHIESVDRFPLQQKAEV